MSLNLPRKIEVTMSVITLKYLNFVVVSLRQAVYYYQSKRNALDDISRRPRVLMQ